MKYLLKYTWPLVAMIALAACNKEMNQVAPEPDPNEGKELIAFSPENNALTRAGTPTGFTNATKVVMRIKAQNGTETDWDDYRYTQTVMIAAAQHDNCSDCVAWGLTTAHSHLTYAANYTRYWDDAFGRDSKLTVYAVAVPDKTDDTIADNRLNHTIDGTNIKTVDATTNPNWYTINDSAEEVTTVSWNVSTVQTSATMAKEDLAYSNNIRESVSGDEMKGRYHQEWSNSAWVKSMELGRLAWTQQSSGSTVGKFDMGHLVFQHALTYLEFNLTEGEGFDNNANTDFVWTNKPSGSTQSFKLVGFNTSGKLDLGKALNESNMWTSTTTNNIIQLKETRSSDKVTVVKMEGYVIPGTELDEVNTNLLEFEIDNAKYYVTGEQIATAILANDANKTSEAAKTMAGKHYVINLTVNKSKISNITAAILSWEEVTANNVGNNNTYCTFDFEDRDNKYVEADAYKFNIYRTGVSIDSYIDDNTTANYAWETGYATEGAATKNWDTDHWSTNWYWKDNKTFYHFRAAGCADNTTSTLPNISINGGDNTQSFNITSGPISGGTYYKDYIWGAPFVDQRSGDTNDWDTDYPLLTYSSTYGFDGTAAATTHQISKAIGATDAQIQMLLFHVTSQIIVNLTTTTGTDKIVLKDGDTKTTVKIVNFLPDGTVLMGTGKVTASGVRNTSGITMTTDDTATGYIAENGSNAAQFNNFTYGMVPQPLTYDTDKHVGLEISTPDGNKYYVRDLSTITGTLTPTNLRNPYTNNVIDTWYPHYKYTYNIILKKKGVLDITAAILPWETVTGNVGGIDLEN